MDIASSPTTIPIFRKIRQSFSTCCALFVFVTISMLDASAQVVETFGHGEYFSKEGERLKITPEAILTTQHYFMEQLYSDLSKRQRFNKREPSIEKKRAVIDQYVEDSILANALMIDVLLDATDRRDSQQMTAINNALRWDYITKFKPLDFKLEEGLFTKGIRPQIAEILERYGITIFLKTNAGGREYREECRDAGVPVPPPMFSSAWQNRGTFTNEFLSDSLEAELWFYESDFPAGGCLALPRYDGDDQAVLLGLICLGTESNKACFWDNPRGTRFPRNVPVDITQFVGGADLVTNAQGTCSDCHAGENPYVVHPDKSAFSGLTPSLQPGGWYDPLVDPSWPQNPGPTNLLAAVSSTSRCDTCHQPGIAGRFPEVSTALPGYCNVVLTTATGGGAKRTMPPGGGSTSNYMAHIDALLAACNDPPSGGGVVVQIDLIPDDEDVISPPLVVDPLYACATQIAVKGSILDAKVTLFINGSAVNSVISRSPSHLIMDVSELQVGDVVTATQEYNGAVSPPSNPVVVRDHRVDYPSGLPKPEIDPTLIYQCGHTIAVRHVPGAKLTVWVNGSDERSRSTSTEWSGIYPGKRPFDVGDQFTAQISLCAEMSPASDPEAAVPAPSSVPIPTFNPAQIYEGQELVTLENLFNGSMTEVIELAMGTLGRFSTPVSWYPEFDLATPLGHPVQGGDQIVAMQKLCEQSEIPEPPRVLPCEDLPAPKIRHPIVGENYVIVTDSVPGARIRVYDAGGNELGDGSGSVIVLNRALTGADTLTVIQQLGECVGSEAYIVSARNGSNQKG